MELSIELLTTSVPTRFWRSGHIATRKRLRFSDGDIAEIMKAGARQPVTSRERRPGRGTA